MGSSTSLLVETMVDIKGVSTLLSAVHGEGMQEYPKEELSGYFFDLGRWVR